MSPSSPSQIVEQWAEPVDAPRQVTRLAVMDQDGNVPDGFESPIPENDLVDLYRTMLLVREFDERMLRLQRQGRMGTFAPVSGQEAAQLGSIYALTEKDWFVPAFRETAASIWRGVDLADLLLYNGGYEEGMRIPDGAHDLPIAIPVGSQIAHAAGIALASRLQGKDECALVYFGDGATSTGDFHAGLNFAAVYDAPAVFLCQNNHWAISIPRAQQTKSETLAQKALGYGMPGVIVDGNDLFAVHTATAAAVERARRGDGPTLIEAVTYRLGVHTTADDPTKYRKEQEVEEWQARDPLKRLRAFLERRGLVTDEKHARWEDEVKERVGDAVDRYERAKDGDPLDMFDYAFVNPPPSLQGQREQFEMFLRRHHGRGGAETEEETVNMTEEVQSS